MKYIRATRTLLDHPEQRTREDHAEDEQDRHYDAGRPDDRRIVPYQIRSDVQTALDVDVLRRRVVLAGFVVGEGLLAARLRDRTAPVVVVLDAAALEPLLGYVPRLGDRALAVGAVERHRGVHLLLHGLGYLFAEHVA